MMENIKVHFISRITNNIVKKGRVYEGKLSSDRAFIIFEEQRLPIKML